MHRRQLLLTTLALPVWAHAHHGWSSFDQSRPIYLAGRVAKVKWQNPHAELALELPANPQLPADLTRRALPAQNRAGGRTRAAGQDGVADPQRPAMGGGVGAADPTVRLACGRDSARRRRGGGWLHLHR